MRKHSAIKRKETSPLNRAIKRTGPSRNQMTSLAAFFWNPKHQSPSPPSIQEKGKKIAGKKKERRFAGSKSSSISSKEKKSTETLIFTLDVFELGLNAEEFLHDIVLHWNSQSRRRRLAPVALENRRKGAIAEPRPRGPQPGSATFGSD